MCPADPLNRYRDKRRAGRTPEPGVGFSDSERRAERPDADARTAPTSALFVIHKHSATRLHWDLRLELAGALKSWAVPRGPSLDPSEKRLAVLVEDHPLEYVEFEDVIPEGNYGAGPMIVWDRGSWLALDDPLAGLERGKLLFELRGHKLRGVWTLVRLKNSEKEWLLIRERRHMPREERVRVAERDRDVPQESILSGLTVEELGEGIGRGEVLREEADRMGAPRRAVRVGQVNLMLARTAERPFSGREWMFELKLDGYRMLAGRGGHGVRLLTRNGHDAVRTFPELERALAALPADEFVLDGEVVMHDESGLPDFQRLQNRARLHRPIDVRRAALRSPATFYAFDLLAVEGRDLRPLPLIERKTLLGRLLPPVGPIRFVDHFPERGEELFREVTALGLEGVMAKRTDSRYRGGRSRDWLKVRAERTAEFAIVGYTAPARKGGGFGALHLAVTDLEGWRYVGRVGSGFSAADRAFLREELDAAAPAPPPRGAPAGEMHVWTRPGHVCEVRFLEWTGDGLLRQPVFVRIRDDKHPAECEWPESGRAATAARTGARSEVPTLAAAVLTNPDKVFWPEEGFTKRDLYEYYRTIAPWLLPYLRDRPLVLTRYPDGIHGKSFYQKSAPAATPEWLRTERVRSRSSEKEIEYFVCDDEVSLLHVANLGAIPLHVWASRVGNLDRPDWCILDLDPKGAPFGHVVRVAKVIHRVCGAIELPSFVKTSGSSGLHVLLPLGGSFTYEQSRALGELLARVVLEEVSDIATIARTLRARRGKVYIDYLQNRRGQLLVAPFSARAVPSASVSTPLRWREIRPDLNIHRYTIRSVSRRLARMQEDPMRRLLDLRPDLPAALSRLSAYLAGEA